jgi:hypothetical protein
MKKYIFTESQIKTIILSETVPLTDKDIQRKLAKAKRLAVNFPNPRQFSLKYKNLYNFLRAKGLMDEVFPERKKYEPYGSWTPERIKELARSYSRITDFQNAYPVAYAKASEYGMINDLFPEKVTGQHFSLGDYGYNDQTSNNPEYQKYVDSLINAAGYFDNMSDLEKRNPALHRQLIKLGHSIDTPVNDEEEDDDDHYMTDFMDDDYDDYLYSGGGSDSYSVEPTPYADGPKKYRDEKLPSQEHLRKPRLRKASEQPDFVPPAPREKPVSTEFPLPAPKNQTPKPPTDTQLGRFTNQYESLKNELDTTMRRLQNTKNLYNTVGPNQKVTVGFYLKQDEDKISQLQVELKTLERKIAERQLKLDDQKRYGL